MLWAQFTLRGTQDLIIQIQIDIYLINYEHINIYNAETKQQLIKNIK